MSINNNQGFAAKNVYPSEQGLHIECSSQEEAQTAYADCKHKGIKFQAPHPLALERFRTDGVDLFIERYNSLVNEQ